MIAGLRTPSGLCVYDYPPDAGSLASGGHGATGDSGVRPEGSSGPLGSGETPLVVLVHGSMDRGTSFTRLRQSLRDLHVIAYDRRGYHRSRAEDQVPADFFGHVEDLFEVIAERRVVALGHSFGGDIVLAGCQRRPDLIAAVVAFEPPLNWRPWWPGPRTGSWMDAGSPGDAAEAFIRRMIGDSRFERLSRATRLERRAEGPALIAELRSLRRIAAEGLPPPFDPSALAVPVVVGRGSATNEHQMRGTTELAAEIPGCELIEIPGAGHAAHLTHPKAVAQMVRRALQRAG